MLRRLAVVLAGAVLLGSLARAEDGKARPGLSAAAGAETIAERAAERAAALKQKLSLSDEQLAKVREILQRQEDQLKTLRAEWSVPEERRLERIMAINRAAQEAILALLTPAQKEKWEGSHRPPPAKAGEPGAGGKEAADPGLIGRVNYLAQKLALTPDQRTKLQEVFLEQAKRARAVRADAALSDEERREKLATVNKEAEDAVVGLLTPPQKVKWDLLQGGGGGPAAPGAGKAKR